VKMRVFERKRTKFSEEMKILQIMSYLVTKDNIDSEGVTTHHLARTAFPARFGQDTRFFGEQRDEDIKEILVKLVKLDLVKQNKVGRFLRYKITEEGKKYWKHWSSFYSLSLKMVYGKKI